MSSIEQSQSVVLNNITEARGDYRDTFWFMQRLNLPVQRGNAASIPCDERERQPCFGR